MKRLLFVICLFTTILTAWGQEFTYTHYNIENGLTGSRVYCTAEDNEGFLWFGTETGLSRFDGTSFKNFTTADGLTDNTVRKIFCDSRGRIWITVFRKSICYIYKGKVHNEKNDSLLAQIKFRANPWQVAEDKRGNILIRENTQLHLVTSDNKVIHITHMKDDNSPIFGSIGTSSTGNFWVTNKKRLYEYISIPGSFVFVKELDVPEVYYYRVHLSKNLITWRSDEHTLKAWSFAQNNGKSYVYPPNYTGLQILDDSLICINSASGTKIINYYTNEQVNYLLNQQKTSSTFKDIEDNFWFTTLDNGLFRLNSQESRSLEFFNEEGKQLSVYSFLETKGNYFAGTDGSQIFAFNLNAFKDIKKYKVGEGLIEDEPNKIIDILALQDGSLLFGSDAKLIKALPDGRVLQSNAINTRKLFLINEDSLIVAGRRTVLLCNPHTLSIIDTLLGERTMCAAYTDNKFYISTLDGLISISRDKKKDSLWKRIPLLSNRISDIKVDKNIMWIATYGAGIIGMQNDKIVANITEQNGLLSNICGCLWVRGNLLWVGSEKGLNRIDISSKPYTVKRFTVTDGLASDVINSVYSDSQYVFAGTSMGITYFDENKIALNSVCLLRITQILSGIDTLQNDKKNISLSHNSNNLYISYSGISYKSAGNITYYYRLKGLDNKWVTTKANFINFQSIPTGSYTLEMYAVNKYGIKSDMISFSITVAPALFEKAWFQILVCICFLWIVWYITQRRIQSVRRSEQQKNEINQKMAELENLALRSQMNPHFIFNCLNAIQHYVMDKDVEGANRFINDFSYLIRQTLNFSSRPEISVEEEIQYLQTYLNLEEERLEHKFRSQISVGENINTVDTFIPSLMLQPYVENAVRHGVRYREDNQGLISITVTGDGGNLLFKIEDNGVGRKASREFRNSDNNAIRYQSKGMSLTESRVELLNRGNTKKINIAVDDIVEGETGKGTIVTASFPVK